MGEYAEMMLDGTCCASCGEFLDADPQGFPGFCASCDPGGMEFNLAPIEERKPFACPSCGKRFKTESAMRTHSDAVHPKKTPIVACPNCGKHVREAGLQMHQEAVGCGRRTVSPVRAVSDDFDLIDDGDDF